MSKKAIRYKLDEKANIVLEVLNQYKSVSRMSAEHDIHEETIKDWIYKYQTNGIEGLKKAGTWRQYSNETKLSAVNAYLAGQGSLRDIIQKYHISDRKVLRQWIKKYTEGESLKPSSKGRSTMTKGRQTTLKERIEIVEYTLAHDKDYQSAVDKYQVSYQQVYAWVRKYEAKGAAGLKDRRGKGLDSKETLTEEEKLKLRIKELEHRNEYLETESGLLKKLRDIERRDRHN